jgi:predicted dehydrogenase
MVQESGQTQLTVNSNETITIGIIGLGHWGLNILRNFINHPRIRVRYICDSSEKALTRAARLLSGECSCVKDASLILGDPEVDAVAIVTPTSTHFALTRAALLAGKHVYCEKPLTPDPEECRILCELAAANDRKLMVGFTFLFNSGIEKVKELLDSGKLGDIYYLTSVRTHLGLIREDVSSVWDLAPHDVSIMNYLLGAVPVKVSAVGAAPLNSGKADIGFINLFYPGDIIGQIHVSWLNSSKERLLKIIGSKARVEFDDLNLMEPVRFYQKGIGFDDQVSTDFGGFKYLLRDGDIISPKVEPYEPLGRMTDAFVRLVLDDVKIVPDAAFALEVTRVLAAAHESMLEHGAPIIVACI